MPKVKIELKVSGNSGDSDTTIRWGHEDFHDNEYFNSWRVIAPASDTKEFDLNDRKSEFEIQTEGGGDTTAYDMSVYFDDKLVLTCKHNAAPGFIKGGEAFGGAGFSLSAGPNYEGELSLRIDLQGNTTGKLW